MIIFYGCDRILDKLNIPDTSISSPLWLGIGAALIFGSLFVRRFYKRREAFF